MIDKIKRNKKIDSQDLQPPQTIKDLIRRYDLDNIKIEDYLDYLVGSLDGELQNLEDNKMDKMTSGTWTPAITTLEGAAPTMTYISRRGSYKKMGKLVYIDFYVRGIITALNGVNNYGMISGLPFKIKQNLSFGEENIPIGVLYHLTNSTANVNLVPYPDSFYLRIQSGYGTSANKLIVTDTDYFEIGGSGWYEID